MRQYDFDYSIEPTHFYAFIEDEKGNQDYVHSPISFFSGWLMCQDKFKERISRKRVDSIEMDSHDFLCEVLDDHPDERIVKSFIDFQIKQGKIASYLYNIACAKIYGRDEREAIIYTHGNYFRGLVEKERVDLSDQYPSQCLFDFDETLFFASVKPTGASAYNAQLYHKGFPSRYLVLAIDPVKFEVLSSAEVSKRFCRHGLSPAGIRIS